MNDFTKGQLTELCQMVKRGTKPCAMMPIKFIDAEKARKICHDNGCKTISHNLKGDWFELWVHIRVELIPIIFSLPEVPKSPSDHYLLGALFGHSNEEICNFIRDEEKKSE